MPDIDISLFKLIYYALPGSVTLILIKELSIQRYDKKNRYTIFELFSVYILSLIIFNIYNIIVNSFIFLNLNQIDIFVSDLTKLSFFSIQSFVILLLISVLISIAFIVLINKRVLFRIARFTRLSEHYGDDDLWSSLCNDKNIEWIFVRDHKCGLLYYGLLWQFSDPGEKRELLLRDVVVYNNETAEKLYHTDYLYIAREYSDLSIEPVLISKEKINGKSRQRNRTPDTGGK